MPDQTTDHLSGAVRALRTLDGFSDMHPLSLREGLKLIAPFFATYYEDKGRADLDYARRTLKEESDERRLAENRAEKAEAEVAAAEDKGRSEKRERLPRAMTEFERKAAEREINREGPPDLGPNDVLRVTYRDLDPPSEEAIRAGQEAAFGRGWAIPEPIMVAILRALLASLDSDQEGS